MAYTVPNSEIDKIYQGIIAEILPQEISYSDITTEQKSQSDFASAIAAYLEPYKQKSVDSVRRMERSQRASIDADAASRGMLSSTYLGDTKNQVTRQARYDVTNLESDYLANIAEKTQSAYQEQLNRVLNVDQMNAANRLTTSQFNSQRRTEAEQTAWDRAFQLAKYNAAQAAKRGGSPDTLDDSLEQSTSYIPYVYTTSPQVRTANARASASNSYRKAFRSRYTLGR